MTQVLDELFKKKTEDGKKPLQVQGLSFIHPMHEAMVAFFKKNVSDSQLCQMFATDEASLRKAIALEVLIDNIEPNKRDQLLRQVNSNTNIAQITEIMALAYAEGRRMSNGSVLREVQVPSDAQGKYFLEAIRRENVNPIYIETSKIADIQTSSQTIRKKTIRNRILKYAGSSLLVGTAALFFYAATNIYQEDQIEKKRLNRQVTAYSLVVDRLAYPGRQTFQEEYQKNYDALEKAEIEAAKKLENKE